MIQSAPWYFYDSLPCPEWQDRPCFALTHADLIIWIGPAYTPASHVYRRIAARMLGVPVHTLSVGTPYARPSAA